MAESTSTGKRFVLPIAVVAVLAFVGGGIAMWIWGPSLDEGRAHRGMQDMMMQRKGDAMEDLLDAMLHGRLDRVAAAADRIEEYTDTIDAFLGTSMYQQHGAAFHQALDDVQRAARDQDREAATDASLRLERACLSCHHLLLDSPEQTWSR